MFGDERDVDLRRARDVTEEVNLTKNSQDSGQAKKELMSNFNSSKFRFRNSARKATRMAKKMAACNRKTVMSIKRDLCKRQQLAPAGRGNRSTQDSRLSYLKLSAEHLEKHGNAHQTGTFEQNETVQTQKEIPTAFSREPSKKSMGSPGATDKRDIQLNGKEEPTTSSINSPEYSLQVDELESPDEILHTEQECAKKRNTLCFRNRKRTKFNKIISKPTKRKKIEVPGILDKGCNMMFTISSYTGHEQEHEHWTETANEPIAPEANTNSNAYRQPYTVPPPEGGHAEFTASQATAFPYFSLTGNSPVASPNVLKPRQYKGTLPTEATEKCQVVPGKMLSNISTAAPHAGKVYTTQQLRKPQVYPTGKGYAARDPHKFGFNKLTTKQAVMQNYGTAARRDTLELSPNWMQGYSTSLSDKRCLPYDVSGESEEGLNKLAFTSNYEHPSNIDNDAFEQLPQTQADCQQQEVGYDYDPSYGGYFTGENLDYGPPNGVTEDVSTADEFEADLYRVTAVTPAQQHYDNATPDQQEPDVIALRTVYSQIAKLILGSPASVSHENPEPAQTDPTIEKSKYGADYGNYGGFGNELSPSYLQMKKQNREYQDPWWQVGGDCVKEGNYETNSFRHTTDDESTEDPNLNENKLQYLHLENSEIVKSLRDKKCTILNNEASLIETRKTIQDRLIKEHQERDDLECELQRFCESSRSREHDYNNRIQASCEKLKLLEQAELDSYTKEERAREEIQSIQEHLREYEQRGYAPLDTDCTQNQERHFESESQRTDDGRSGQMDQNKLKKENEQKGVGNGSKRKNELRDEASPLQERIQTLEDTIYEVLRQEMSKRKERVSIQQQLQNELFANERLKITELDNFIKDMKTDDAGYTWLEHQQKLENSKNKIDALREEEIMKADEENKLRETRLSLQARLEIEQQSILEVEWTKVENTEDGISQEERERVEVLLQEIYNKLEEESSLRDRRLSIQAQLQEELSHHDRLQLNEVGILSAKDSESEEAGYAWLDHQQKLEESKDKIEELRKDELTKVAEESIVRENRLSLQRELRFVLQHLWEGEWERAGKFMKATARSYERIKLNISILNYFAKEEQETQWQRSDPRVDIDYSRKSKFEEHVQADWSAHDQNAIKQQQNRRPSSDLIAEFSDDLQRERIEKLQREIYHNQDKESSLREKRISIREQLQNELSTNEKLQVAEVEMFINDVKSGDAGYTWVEHQQQIEQSRNKIDQLRKDEFRKGSEENIIKMIRLSLQTELELEQQQHWDKKWEMKERGKAELANINDNFIKYISADTNLKVDINKETLEGFRKNYKMSLQLTETLREEIYNKLGQESSLREERILIQERLRDELANSERLRVIGVERFTEDLKSNDIGYSWLAHKGELEKSKNRIDALKHEELSKAEEQSVLEAERLALQRQLDLQQQQYWENEGAANMAAEKVISERLADVDDVRTEDQRQNNDSPNVDRHMARVGKAYDNENTLGIDNPLSRRDLLQKVQRILYQEKLLEQHLIFVHEQLQEELSNNKRLQPAEVGKFVEDCEFDYSATWLEEQQQLAKSTNKIAALEQEEFVKKAEQSILKKSRLALERQLKLKQQDWEYRQMEKEGVPVTEKSPAKEPFEKEDLSPARQEVQSLDNSHAEIHGDLKTDVAALQQEIYDKLSQETLLKKERMSIQSQLHDELSVSEKLQVVDVSEFIEDMNTGNAGYIWLEHQQQLEKSKERIEALKAVEFEKSAEESAVTEHRLSLQTQLEAQQEKHLETEWETAENQKSPIKISDQSVSQAAKHERNESVENNKKATDLNTDDASANESEIDQNSTQREGIPLSKVETASTVVESDSMSSAKIESHKKYESTLGEKICKPSSRVHFDEKQLPHEETHTDGESQNTATKTGTNLTASPKNDSTSSEHESADNAVSFEQQKEQHPDSHTSHVDGNNDADALIHSVDSLYSAKSTLYEIKDTKTKGSFRSALSDLDDANSLYSARSDPLAMRDAKTIESLSSAVSNYDSASEFETTVKKDEDQAQNDEMK